VVASAMRSERAVAMDYEHGHFKSLDELARCMHASCLLPGIAGPVVNILRDTSMMTSSRPKPKFVLRNGCVDPDYEPLADALIYAPIAYDLALEEGATHMIVLRSKPDGGDVVGKGGSIGEKLVWSRFFLRKNKLPRMYERLTQQLHKRLYARNVLELNVAANSPASSRLPPTLTVALPPSQKEIARLETSREVIFEGVRQGFARAFDTLVEDPKERGRGYEVATSFFPDEILQYSPEKLRREGDDATGSAFATYLAESGIWPKAWGTLSEPPTRFAGYTQANVSSAPSSATADATAKTDQKTA
jgi:predicted acylesterase/phospholipase RssA